MADTTIQKQKITPSEVEQSLDSFDFDDHLLNQFDTLQDELNNLEVKFQVFLHKLKEISNG
jgi:hypothetical protein